MAASTEHSFGVIPVIMRDGEPHFLLVQHNAGHWGFPKGHAEKGEAPPETARRELREETGVEHVRLLEDRPLEETYWYVRKGRRTKKTVTYFVGFVESDEVTPQVEEVQALAWGPYDETMKRLSFKQGRQLLERAAEILSESSG